MKFTCLTPFPKAIWKKREVRTLRRNQGERRYGGSGGVNAYRRRKMALQGGESGRQDGKRVSGYGAWEERKL